MDSDTLEGLQEEASKLAGIMDDVRERLDYMLDLLPKGERAHATAKQAENAATSLSRVCDELAAELLTTDWTVASSTGEGGE